MSETQVLRAFFDAYEALQAIPKSKGRPSMEQKAAQERVDMAAAAVRNWTPEGPIAPVAPAAEMQSLRAFQQQVAGIPPKDTRGPAKKGEVNITNG